MVIPSTGEMSQAIGIGIGANKATAAMPIPTNNNSSSNISTFPKLSSSAPGDKCVGSLLDYDLTSQLSSSSQGISSYLTAENFLEKKQEEEPIKKEEEKEEEEEVKVEVAPPPRKGPLTMDLEPSDRIMETNSGKYRRKFTDPELPPHLSEYSELNVISIVNQCDPERGRRCYSCGYDNTEKWLLKNNYYYRQQQKLKNQRKNNNNNLINEPYTWTLQHQYPTQPPQVCWNSNYFQTEFVQSGSVSGQRKRVYSDGEGGSGADLGEGENAMDDEEVFTFDVRKREILFIHAILALETKVIDDKGII
jgi:hypothetical protein